MDSFDQAPIATIVEQKLVRWLCAQAGLPATADGTFTAGGSQSNYMGLLLARDAFLKKQWNWPAQKRGLHPEAGRLRILCSEVAHFTVEKSAAQLGLGTDAVVRVAACDDQFRMSLMALREEIEQLQAQGLLPMAIVATAGTTDFGSIDPIADIAEDCPPGGSMASRGCRLRWCSSVLPSPARQAGGTGNRRLRFHRLPQAVLAAHSMQRVSAGQCAAFRFDQNARRLSQPRSPRSSRHSGSGHKIGAHQPPLRRTEALDLIFRPSAVRSWPK